MADLDLGLEDSVSASSSWWFWPRHRPRSFVLGVLASIQHHCMVTTPQEISCPQYACSECNKELFIRHRAQHEAAEPQEFWSSVFALIAVCDSSQSQIEPHGRIALFKSNIPGSHVSNRIVVIQSRFLSSHYLDLPNSPMQSSPVIKFRPWVLISINLAYFSVNTMYE